MLIYKFVSAVGDSDTYEFSSSVPQNTIEKIAIQDSFDLKPNYRDPFFGKVFSQKNKVRKKKRKPKAEKTVAPKEVTDWSFIKYMGQLQSHDGKKKTVLLQLWGADRMVHELEEINEFQLLEIYRDSIFVSYKKEKKYIVR